MKDEKNDAQEQSETIDIYVKRPTSVIVRTLVAYVVIGLIWCGIIWVALHLGGFVKSDSVVAIEEVDTSTEQYIQSLIEATCYHQKTLSLQKNDINPNLNPTSMFLVTDFDGFPMYDRAEVWCVTEVAKATLGVDGWLVEDKENTWFVLRENHKLASDSQQSNIIMTDIPERTYLKALERYKETVNNLKQYELKKELENEQ